MFNRQRSRSRSSAGASLAVRAISAIRRLGGSAWFVPDNYAGTYIESTGITPVSNVGDVIGLTLDRSYGSANLGPNLVPDLSDAGWYKTNPAWATVGNKAVATACPDGQSYYRTGASAAKKSYRYTITLESISSGAVYVSIGGSVSSQAFNSAGTYTGVLTTATSNSNINIVTAGVTTATVSSFSLREVLGNHASQITHASKPVVGRGVRNDLTWSHDLTNVVWSAGNIQFYTRVLETGTGPGGTNCTRLTATATAATPGRQITAATAAETYAFVAKAGTFNPSSVLIRNITTSTNLTTTVTSVSLGDGWTLYCGSASSGITAGNVLQLYFGSTVAIPDGQHFFIASAGAFDGVYTAQQILDRGGIPLTTTAPAWSATGKLAMFFDGSNDFLQTNITTGNEGWICAGVNFQGAAGANETVFANGAGNAGQKGVWFVRMGILNENQMRMGIGNGTALTMPTIQTIPLRNTPRVVEGGWATDSVLVGVDGSTASTARTGDATPAPNQTIIGSFLSGQHPMQGPLIALVYTPTLPSPSDRALIRRWIGSLQGQTL